MDVGLCFSSLVPVDVGVAGVESAGAVCGAGDNINVDNVGESAVCKLFTLDEGEESKVTELLVLRVGFSDDSIARVDAWHRGDFLEFRTGFIRDLRIGLSIS